MRKPLRSLNWLTRRPSIQYRCTGSVVAWPVLYTKVPPKLQRSFNS